jgi:hypothetical protein
MAEGLGGLGEKGSAHAASDMQKNISREAVDYPIEVHGRGFGGI